MGGPRNYFRFTVLGIVFDSAASRRAAIRGLLKFQIGTLDLPSEAVLERLGAGKK